MIKSRIGSMLQHGSISQGINVTIKCRFEIADWLLDSGDRYIQNRDLEKGITCNHLAARILRTQNRDLVSERIESNLHLIGKSLPVPKNGRLVSLSKSAQRKVCLHVLNEALPYGGHTAMAIRWMKNDCIKRTHSVALLSQKSPVPHDLARAVLESGGDVYISDTKESFIRRALWLRRKAFDLADYVVLHVNVDDVITGAAFGVNGGPPVLLVNHAAHIFWLGASVADLVVNCRGSELEKSWTEMHRGIARHATIPIPLVASRGPCIGDDLKVKMKNHAKERLGLPKNSVIILTVGDSYKYTPMGKLDFTAVSEKILEEVSNAFILAVGPTENQYWKIAAMRTGSRIRTFGRQSSLTAFHQAADLYMEGFPFGSTTACLEAGLQGIPLVLAPAQCPPPYGSDGVALDEVIEHPTSIEEYIKAVIELSKNCQERNRLGARISNAIRKHHTGVGWSRYLEEALEQLPREHVAYLPIRRVPTPDSIHNYWTQFKCLQGETAEKTLYYCIKRGLTYGVRLRVPSSIVKSCKHDGGARIGRTIPWPILLILCNALFQIAPRRWAISILDEITWQVRSKSRIIRILLRILPYKMW